MYILAYIKIISKKLLCNEEEKSLTEHYMLPNKIARIRNRLHLFELVVKGSLQTVANAVCYLPEFDRKTILLHPPRICFTERREISLANFHRDDSYYMHCRGRKAVFSVIQTCILWVTIMDSLGYVYQCTSGMNVMGVTNLF